MYRFGSLIGAAYFTWAMDAGLEPKTRQFLLLAVTVAWGANSAWLGILAERHQKEMEEEAAAGKKELL